MPSAMQDMSVTPRVFVPAKGNAKIKPTLLVVDNVNAAADAVITIVDRFTPSASNAVPAPVEQTPVRLRVNVAQLACVSLQDELKDVEILGQLEVARGVADANCFVTVAWEFM